MQEQPPQTPPPDDEEQVFADGRRRSGRLEQEFMYCDFGQVLDLSAGGMRISCRRVPPAGQFTVDLHGIDEVIQLKARVAWKRRVSLFKHEVGVQFLDVGPELGRKLTSLATTCRMRRAI